MAPPNPPGYCLTDIPSELLMIILLHCSNSTLKSLRLSSKALARSTEPLLFEKVALLPSVCCIESLTDLLEESQLARHIHEVIYDCRWGAMEDLLGRYLDIPDVAEYGDYVFTKPSEAESIRRDRIIQEQSSHQFHNYFSYSNDTQDVTGSKQEIAILTALLKHLPSVKSLVFKAPSPWKCARFCDAPPAYLQQVYRKLDAKNPNWNDHGIAYYNDDRIPGPLLFAAANTGLSIKSSSCEDLLPRYLIPIPCDSDDEEDEVSTRPFRELQPLISGLESLDLSFNPFHDSEQWPPIISFLPSDEESLISLLRASTSLKTLKLTTDIHRFPFNNYVSHRGDPYLPKLLTDQEQYWSVEPIMPRLESFSLRICACKEEGLIHFLQIHSRTLRHLQLWDIQLKPDGQRVGCWVRVIKFLKSQLNLNSMSCKGSLSEDKGRHWGLTEEEENSDPNSLKSRIERYVVDKDYVNCPLEEPTV